MLNLQRSVDQVEGCQCHVMVCVLRVLSQCVRFVKRHTGSYLESHHDQVLIPPSVDLCWLSGLGVLM
jgi:hypothetical protein